MVGLADRDKKGTHSLRKIGRSPYQTFSNRGIDFRHGLAEQVPELGA